VKVTNISQFRLYLNDLRFTPQSQTEGRRGEDQYLNPGDFVYLPNTSEVIRSVFKGDLKRYRDQGYVELEDEVTLASSASVTLTHNFGLPPNVYAFKQVMSTWVDATGTFDSVHNSSFTEVIFTNTTPGALTYLIRLG
jgi:hypothetical protein